MTHEDWYAIKTKKPKTMNLTIILWSILLRKYFEFSSFLSSILIYTSQNNLIICYQNNKKILKILMFVENLYYVKCSSNISRMF